MLEVFKGQKKASFAANSDSKDSKNAAAIQEDPQEPDNVVNLLLDIQAKDGYLSEQSMRDLAKKEKMPAVNIYGVATFYAQFKLTKPGRHIINICKGTACHVKNSDTILEYIQEYLEIKKGETTKDGRISLHTVNCIGACAKAPAMMVDNTVYGELTKKKVKDIIDALK